MPLKKLMDIIHTEREVPLNFKSGVITPILKKNKAKHLPDNHRRITVAATTGKVLEKLVNPTIENSMETKQSIMQRGFTCGSSSSNAALLYTEALAEAADQGVPLYTTMLDASKAFDVVAHENLLVDLFDHGVEGTHWSIMQDWYKGITSQVKWGRVLSRPISEQMGLRQGGGLSTGQYKTYTNKNLISQEQFNLGFSVGTQYIGCPTCADDTALVHNNSIDMQTAIHLCDNFARKQRFEYSKSKTKILVHSNTKTL